MYFLEQTRCSFLFLFTLPLCGHFFFSLWVTWWITQWIHLSEWHRDEGVYIHMSLGVWAPTGSFTSALISCCSAARLWHCLSLFPSSCATEGNPTLPSARSVAHNSWGRGCMQGVKHFSSTHCTEGQNENRSLLSRFTDIAIENLFYFLTWSKNYR